MSYITLIEFKGVRHHGGFDVVAQILNLRPYRPYLIKASEYPDWIEEEWIERKMNEDCNTSSIHRHAIPEYLKQDSRVKNIRGKQLTGNDKRRIIREIYKKINVKYYEDDVERREAMKYEYKLYKDKLRNDIIEEEDRLGFAINGIRQRNSDGNYIKNEVIESDKHAFDRKLYSTNDQHILFSDAASSHIDTEEREFDSKQESRRSKIKNRLSSLMRLRKKK